MTRLIENFSRTFVHSKKFIKFPYPETKVNSVDNVAETVTVNKLQLLADIAESSQENEIGNP
jgi:hypothetical protein